MRELSREDALDYAKRLRADDVAWRAISRKVGLSVDIIRRALDPAFAHQEYLRKGKTSNKIVGKILHHYDGPRVKPEEAIRVLQSIPADTRPPFARLMGDPLPGRSALERRT